jgi:nitroreductase
MDAMEAILTRRSVRKYTDKNISNDLILELIEAGTSAPSAGNQQPWHFIIIDDRKLIDKIPDFHPHSKMLFDAQKAILVCGDLAFETNKGFWVQDCSAATQNILIAARAKGLGSCWLGVYPRDERMDGFRKMFNLPKKVIPFSLISLGYPAVDQSRVDRYDSTRIHTNKW